MKAFQNLAIQKKMLVMTLLICGAVLCLAVAVFFVFQVLNFRTNFQRDTATLAEIMANNSTGAVAFSDDRAAIEQLGSLKARPTIFAANLILPDGTVFATYGQKETRVSLTEFPIGSGDRFLGGALLSAYPVMLKGERIATLYLRSDFEHTFRQLLEIYGFVIAGITVASILLVLWLADRLGRTITGPVLQLSQLAQTVGEKKDYSLRAVRPAGHDELDRLTQAFNEMLGRIQTQDAALSFSRQKMEALVNSIDGIVWERSPDTFKFTFISRQSEDLLGYAPALWLDTPNFWESKLHPLDSVKAVHTCHAMAAQGQPYALEYRLAAADGRPVWIRESGTILQENGRPAAMRGIFQDITRQKEDAEQLDKLNRQLMDTSRQAGMAEVATGVLHNVGNILNSVSVSSTLVCNRLKEPHVGNLHRATGMLQGQNGHLGEFLTSHPKGKMLPEYLGKMADLLVGEKTFLLKHMTAVGEHIEHIKEIVSMQQSYAKVSGVYEILPLASLVEDALRMNLAAFDRHHIELIRDFEDNMPLVSVDRHKMLQILINILRNAKHAMDSREDHEKRMIIRVRQSGPAHVAISIIDNGIGIAPELLTKIFNHGFTTKKDGHGFGLHSGANAAKQMGGTLTASSDGLNKGATFTLELPAANPKRPMESAIRLQAAASTP